MTKITEEILDRIEADHHVLSIVTHEWQRVESSLGNISVELGRRLFKWTSAQATLLEWNHNEGEWVPSKLATQLSLRDEVNTIQPDDEPSHQGRYAADVLMDWYRNEIKLKDSILWIEDLSANLDPHHNPLPEHRRLLVRRIRQFCQHNHLVEKKTVIMTFPGDYLPMELEKDVEQFRVPLPDKNILAAIYDDHFIDDNGDNVLEFDDEIRSGLIRSALGLTVQEVDGAFRQVLARKKRKGVASLNLGDAKVLDEQKKQIIEKTGVLEYITHRESMDDIGGMSKLKEWLEIHRGSLEDKQDPPKGLLLMGVPGCGKSLMARAVAKEWRLPLLALKASQIFDKYVGESEGKIQRALDIAEAIAPCVLWVDEIEKLLAGAGGDGSNDSGVSARVGASILSWMADKTAPVFVVATANHPERLDAEYVRRGRFDERFFIDLPGVVQREEIFKKKLSSRSSSMDNYDLKKLAEKTHIFTGAEIQAVVVEAKNMLRFEVKNAGGNVEAALTNGPSMDHLLKAIEDMVPDAAANATQIERIRKLWITRARPADASEPIDIGVTSKYGGELREAVDENNEFQNFKKRRNLG